MQNRHSESSIVTRCVRPLLIGMLVAHDSWTWVFCLGSLAFERYFLLLFSGTDISEFRSTNQEPKTKDQRPKTKGQLRYGDLPYQIRTSCCLRLSDARSRRRPCVDWSNCASWLLWSCGIDRKRHGRRILWRLYFFLDWTHTL